MKQLAILISNEQSISCKYHLQNNHLTINYLGFRNKFWVLLKILILSFLLSSISAKSKEMISKYDLEMLGAKIGEFSVTQKNENGNVEIEAVTDMKIKFLFSYHVKYIQSTVYKQGILKSSNVKTYKNGKLNSDVTLKQEKDAYLLIANTDTTVINDSITYSGSLIYFNEPLGIKRLYKERTAEMKPLTQLTEHTYIICDEKERELNRYVYKDGVLEYAEMRHAMGMLELKRVKENTTND